MKRTQIIALYELNGLDAPEIAQTLDLEIAIVRDVLQSGSELYKTRVEEGREEDVSKEVMKRAFKKLVDVMDNERTSPRDAIRAAMYLIDERKGRNDSKANKEMAGIHDGMLALNSKLQQMRLLNTTPKPKELTLEATPA